MKIVLLGPPGAGKGTQGQALAQICRVPHVATGDIIRDHIARQTEFGRKVEAAIAAGNFASDEDILYWVERRLAEPDAQAGYILDGFPRDVAQAEAWNQAINAVVDLEAAEGALVERLAGRIVCPVCRAVYNEKHHSPKRPGICDDEPEAVRHRLQVYRNLTAPLQAYYAGRGLLRRIDAGGAAEAVTKRIQDALAI